jgi:hypothetical protein
LPPVAYAKNAKAENTGSGRLIYGQIEFARGWPGSAAIGGGRGAIAALRGAQSDVRALVWAGFSHFGVAPALAAAACAGRA